MTPLIIAERPQCSIAVITRVFNQSCAQQMQRWRNVQRAPSGAAFFPWASPSLFRRGSCHQDSKAARGGHMSQMELFSGTGLFNHFNAPPFSKITNQYSVLHIPILHE